MFTQSKMLMLGGMTVLAYWIAALYSSWNLEEKKRYKRILIFVSMAVAIFLHAVFLHRQIDLAQGQNISLVNMSSFVIWLIALLMLFFSFYKPIQNLLLFIFLAAAFTIFLMMIFPLGILVDTGANPKQLFHILLAALTISVLGIAGLQAILLAIQEWQLKHAAKQRFFQKFPPLQTMEIFLFQVILVGFILLSIMIITSLYSFYDRITMTLLQKILLALVAWIIFGILLLGRHFAGWRGRRAIYGTLAGVLLLLFIYLGSTLLLRAFI